MLDAIASLRREWAARDGLEHPFLSRPSLLPTMARSGEWPVTYPARCDLTIAVMYLPAQADERGWGSRRSPRGRGLDRAREPPARTTGWPRTHR